MRLADREAFEALAATGRLDSKLTGANPVHVMIEWSDCRSHYTDEVLELIGDSLCEQLRVEIGILDRDPLAPEPESSHV